MIEHYLDEVRKVGKKVMDEHDTVDHLLMEAEVYGLIYTFGFIGWGFSPHPFERDDDIAMPLLFLEWVKVNIEFYNERKAAFIAKYGRVVG